MKWHKATLLSSRIIAKNAKSLILSARKIKPHIPGQYYNVRIISKEGFVTERQYSAANSSNLNGLIELGVKVIKNGELSPFLNKLKVGGQLELKGPLGKDFIFNKNIKSPLLLIAGGSGIVPIMSILREINDSEIHSKIIVLASFKTEEDIFYYDEIKKLKKLNPTITILITLTQKSPNNWTELTGRINKKIIMDVISKFNGITPLVFISGSTIFVEDMKALIKSEGIKEKHIKVEKFG